MSQDADLEPRREGAAAPEEGVGIAPDLVRDVTDALAVHDKDRLRFLIAALRAAEMADLIEHLAVEDRNDLVQFLGPEIDPEILSELDEDVREQVLELMGPKRVAAAITELNSDDAVDLIEDLDEDVQKAVLKAVTAEDRAILETGLAYPEESAGRLMQRELVWVQAYWTIGEVIDHLRTAEDLPDDFYDLFVVDAKHCPVGTVSLSRVLRTNRPVTVGEIMVPNPVTVPVNMDQEDVAFMFRQQDLISAPVVEADGRLVGVITVDDVVDVIDEEAEEDLMHLGGVRQDDFYRAVVDTTRSRFAWLVVNLATAVLASAVIGIFEPTIQHIVALAVLMPIVASMGGNAGTQTLTVAVRALATKELTAANAMRVIGKEILVGSFNGILFAVLTAIVTWAWFGSPAIGAVIGAAMVVNLIVAGLAGTAIPIGLERAGIDPAVASGVFLTTVTDVVGFLAFLGLATLFLL
ncbi:MAG: magnesium transporter [Alphaproteobacteria bacterium]